MTMQTIPLVQLVPSPDNVRKTKTGIEGLAASIAAHGLLQNLAVRPVNGKGFEVLAGGRRLAALQLLAKQKKIAGDFPVPCDVREDSAATEISLAENEMREQMHPADQFEAFKKLADEGKGPEEIAARFGTTPRIVEQRLKLAVVSPKLIAAYRSEEMTLDCLMAFTVSDDHKAQEKACR
jgi:ParB family chromosome partitioning protein